jgi:hypothetical protein
LVGQTFGLGSGDSSGMAIDPKNGHESCC